MIDPNQEVTAPTASVETAPAADTTATATPIAGYTTPSEDNIALVNEFKALEASLGVLYRKAAFAGADSRMLAIGKTQAQDAFMWLNRSIFKPTDVFNT